MRIILSLEISKAPAAGVAFFEAYVKKYGFSKNNLYRLLRDFVKRWVKETSWQTPKLGLYMCLLLSRSSTSSASLLRNSIPWTAITLLSEIRLRGDCYLKNSSGLRPLISHLAPDGRSFEPLLNTKGICHLPHAVVTWLRFRDDSLLEKAVALFSRAKMRDSFIGLAL